MTKILGIAAYYHDSSATLVVDGKIIAAVQEERFSRKKHDAAFPMQAVLYCLAEGECQLADLDAVIFYDKPMLKFERLLETYLAEAPIGFLSFLKAMPVWLKEKLYMKTILRRELCTVFKKQQNDRGTATTLSDKKIIKNQLPKLLFSRHHQAHAASAFFPGPFSKAAVICLDGVGEWATSSVWLGEQETLTPLWEINFPHSLGLLYSAFTYYCGFRVNSGEYKLMGLAPYGKPVYVELILKHLIDVKPDGSFNLNMDYFDYPTGAVMTNQAFSQLFSGAPRDPESALQQKQMDLAKSIQVVIEQVLLKIADHVFQQTGCENLCLAGGVALNCVANGRLLREGPFKSIWIQPAAGDAGGSLGAALLAYHQHFQQPRDTTNRVDPDGLLNDQMQGSYLGPAYSDPLIKDCLLQQQIPYQCLDDAKLFNQVAELIDNGQVIGWYQGRMEFGPRALGNRSILGDPRNQQMQSVMNLKIKNRESFRPFAPAVLAEKMSDYFYLQTASPYMLLVTDVHQDIRIEGKNEPQQGDDLQGINLLKQQRSLLPAITHVDYSARVQTVHQQSNPRFHALISAFQQRTGIAVLINTSFNVRGEPPVCSPEDALNCFLATEMDYLVMNNFIVDKAQMSADAINRAKQITFAPD